MLTPEFRVSHPKVFSAEKNDLNGEMEYSLVALFSKGADLSEMKKAAEQVLADKFGSDKAKWPTGLRNPFRDQKEKTAKNKQTGQVILDTAGNPQLQVGCEAGAIFVNMKSNAKNGRPGVVDQSVQPIIEPHAFYSGCYARASVNPYYYDKKGNRGVAFGLNNVQKTRDGEPLGGRAAPAADFQPIAGAASAGASGAKSVFDE
jgi:hypothetical protein